MKAIFILILLLNNLIITATTFYVSSNGSDLSDGQSPHSSWKTIKKLNSEFSGFTPGDKVLFRRGDTFYGTILLSASGIAGKPIILGAYGAGEKPIISGFATVSDWTDKGGGIFAKAIDCESIPNMVTVNGINTPIGRWPNSGYLTIDSHITNSSIYDSSLPSIPNWTGAEVVIRKNAYIWDRNVI